MLIVLVDHDVFKSVPLDERAAKLVYDTRGIWPDQPANQSGRALRMAASACTLSVGSLAARDPLTCIPNSGPLRAGKFQL